MALFMSVGYAVAANPTNPDLLSQGFDDNWGSNATYDAATKTITYPGAWGSMVWTFWNNGNISAYKQLVIEFEPADFTVQPVIQYNDSVTPEFKQGFPGSSGKITMDLVSTAKIGQIAIQTSAAGKLVLKAAYLSDGKVSGGDKANTVINFDADTVGTKYPVVAWSPADISAVVEKNPAGTGNSLHIINNNWNSYPLFSVTLPTGKTLSDVDSLAFDLYFQSIETVDGQTPNSYKSFDYFIGSKGTAFHPLTTTGSANNIVAKPEDNPGQTWLHKKFAMVVPDSIIKLALNKFDFGFGMGINKAGNYFLDNITFVLKGGTGGIIPLKPLVSQAYGVLGGVVVNAVNEKVSIYGMDGNLVKQSINVDKQTISLERGLYIVKVGNAKAVKVIVR